MSIFGIPVSALTVIAAYVLIISVITFIAFGLDKYKARKGKWRTPESTLLGLAFIGGALGALLGMLAFRHKTRHKKFQILVPLFLILQTALAVCFLFFSLIEAMDTPDIMSSTPEERKQFVKDMYPCLNNCEICGLCALFHNRDSLDVYADYIDGKRSFEDISSEVRQGR